MPCIHTSMSSENTPNIVTEENVISNKAAPREVKRAEKTQRKLKREAFKSMSSESTSNTRHEAKRAEKAMFSF